MNFVSVAASRQSAAISQGGSRRRSAETLLRRLGEAALTLGLLLAGTGPARAERIIHAGRILGPAPVVTTSTLFNTPEADAIIVQPGAGFIWETWLTRRVGADWEAWNGATFALERKTALASAPWETVVTTDARAFRLPMVGFAAFFQLRGD